MDSYDEILQIKYILSIIFFKKKKSIKDLVEMMFTVTKLF